MAATSPAVSQSTAPARRKARIDYNGSTDPVEIISTNRVVASPFQVSKHKKDAARQWDVFYKNNADGFFKDRHWTDREFEVLSALDEQHEDAEAGKIVLEVGCGTGAFVYPLLERYPSARFHAFDFSKRAVELVQKNPLYDPSRVHAFVHDLTATSPTLPDQLASAPAAFWVSSVSLSSPDSTSSLLGAVEALPQRPYVVSCIFVISALPPSKQAAAIRSLVEVLAPGGTILFRDYALHDQAQLRFHALPSQGYASVPSLLSGPLPSSAEALDSEALAELGKPWYRRGDGTMTYFFTAEEVDAMVKAGCEEGYRMEGEVSVVERAMENRAEGWGCTRKFVQGSWRKLRC